jgi:hypothetical protein
MEKKQKKEWMERSLNQLHRLRRRRPARDVPRVETVEWGDGRSPASTEGATWKQVKVSSDDLRGMSKLVSWT